MNLNKDNRILYQYQINSIHFKAITKEEITFVLFFINHHPQ